MKNCGLNELGGTKYSIAGFLKFSHGAVDFGVLKDGDSIVELAGMGRPVFVRNCVLCGDLTVHPTIMGNEPYCQDCADEVVELFESGELWRGG